MNDIQAVFFDIDGVIRIWDRSIDARAERESGIPPGELFKTAFADEFVIPAITGKVTDEEWRESVSDRLQSMYPESNAKLAIGVWSSPSGMINEPVLQLARRCRENCPVGLISNATSRLNYDLEILGIAGEFDYIINSSDVGVTKPEAEIYEAACTSAGTQPSQTFFTDDQQRHVEGAIAVGLTAYVFTNPETLGNRLTHHGLL